MTNRVSIASASILRLVSQEKHFRKNCVTFYNSQNDIKKFDTHRRFENLAGKTFLMLDINCLLNYISTTLRPYVIFYTKYNVVTNEKLWLL